MLYACYLICSCKYTLYITTSRTHPVISMMMLRISGYMAAAIRNRMMARYVM